MNEQITAWLWDDNDGFGGCPNPKLGFEYPQHIKSKAAPLYRASHNYYDGVMAAIRAIESSQHPDASSWDCVDAIKKKLLADYEQPTTDQLRRALSEVFACSGFAPSESAAIANLRVLRNRRHTWMGHDEHDLMFKIDNVLFDYDHPRSAHNE